MLPADPAIAAAKKVLEGKPSASEMKAEFEKLQALVHKLTSELYKQTGAAPGAEGAADGQAQGEAKAEEKADDVIDADFKDVN